MIPFSAPTFNRCRPSSITTEPSSISRKRTSPFLISSGFSLKKLRLFSRIPDWLLSKLFFATLFISSNLESLLTLATAAGAKPAISIKRIVCASPAVLGVIKGFTFSKILSRASFALSTSSLSRPGKTRESWFPAMWVRLTKPTPISAIPLAVPTTFSLKVGFDSAISSSVKPRLGITNSLAIWPRVGFLGVDGICAVTSRTILVAGIALSRVCWNVGFLAGALLLKENRCRSGCWAAVCEKLNRCLFSAII